jgi:hypothetical protein
MGAMMRRRDNKATMDRARISRIIALIIAWVFFIIIACCGLLVLRLTGPAQIEIQNSPVTVKAGDQAVFDYAVVHPLDALRHECYELGPLTVDGLPPGCEASYEQVAPCQSARLIIATQPTTPQDVYQLIVSLSNEPAVRSEPFTLEIVAP